MPDARPLRLRPPTRTADAALGERLAELARASTPTTVRLRSHRWAAPVAGVALLVASGGVAWGTHAVAHHTPRPDVVPGVRLAPVPPPGPARVAGPEPAASPAPSRRPASSGSSAGVAGHLDHAHAEDSTHDQHRSGGADTHEGPNDQTDASAPAEDSGDGTAAATPEPSPSSSSPDTAVGCADSGSTCD